MDRLDALAALVQTENESILSYWRQRVREHTRAAKLDRATLEDGIRHFLDELSNALIETVNTGKVPSRMDVGPMEHGLQRFGLGFDIEMLVTEFSILRSAIIHASEQHGITLSGLPRLALHQIIDKAIAGAVRSFSEAQKAEFDRRVQERLAMVVHDLKTPLSAVQTAFHIMDARLSSETRQAVTVLLGIILRNCDHLNKMLMTLLDQTSRDKMVLHSDLTRSDCELQPLVEEIINNLEPLSHKTGVPIVNNVPSALCVNVDAFLFRQAIQNLLSNALKYTEEGQVTVDAVVRDSEAVVSIADTGIGIPPENLSRLFLRQEADPLRSDSSGFGLAIVKRIVDAHRGQLRVESAVGKGTKVEIVLPHYS